MRRAVWRETALVHARNASAEIAMTYDAAGRLLSSNVNGHTLSLTRDQAGRVVGRRTPSGAESSWDYDPAGRPCVLRDGGAPVTLEYDTAGRSSRQILGDGIALTQSWDQLGRLTAQDIQRHIQRPPSPAEPVRRYARREDGHIVGVEGPRGTTRYRSGS